MLTNEELARLGIPGHPGPLYLAVSRRRGELTIRVWRGRTFGFLHGYIGHVMRYA